MRQLVVSVSNGIHQVVRRIATFTVALMFGVVMFQVIVRYVFNTPPVWTEDVARYAMVWTGLLGATLSFKTKSDAVLMQSVFPQRPNLLGLIADAIHSAAVLTFLLPIIYFCFVGLRGGFAKGYLSRQAGLTMDTLGIPMVWISVAVPIAMTIILVHLMARWCEGRRACDDNVRQSQLD